MAKTSKKVPLHEASPAAMKAAVESADPTPSADPEDPPPPTLLEQMLRGADQIEQLLTRLGPALLKPEDQEFLKTAIRMARDPEYIARFKDVRTPEEAWLLTSDQDIANVAAALAAHVQTKFSLDTDSRKLTAMYGLLIHDIIELVRRFASIVKELKR